MMTALKYFCLTCVVLVKMAQTNDFEFSMLVHQERRFVSVKVGDELVLECSYAGDIGTRFYWYKQTPWQKPRLISSFFKFDLKGTFHDELKNNPRFTLDTEIPKNNLKITDLHVSDSATYYCAGIYSYNFQFGEGITVSVQDSDSNIQAFVHQSSSASVHPEDPVSLNCTVHTGSCDGEHSVYWFRPSEDSQPGVIYTDGGRNDQCERKPDTQTHTCVYNLPIQNVGNSHNGILYCAVASCGQVLFGNGTKVDSKYEVDPLVYVYFLSAALGFTTILNIVLAFIVFTKSKSCHRTGSDEQFSINSRANAETQNEENVHYAAFSELRVNRTGRQRSHTKSECIYSSVKQ